MQSYKLSVLDSVQLSKFAKDAVSYAQALIEAVMGGLEGLINILDSEGGYGSLDNKVSTILCCHICILSWSFAIKALQICLCISHLRYLVLILS